MKLPLLVTISRPRFWIYTLGPLALGLAALGRSDFSTSELVRIGILFLFFSFPANLYIYGVNDIHDYETDKHNPKKQGYETLLPPQKQGVLNAILALTLALSMGYAYAWEKQAVYLPLFLFFFLSHYYSAPPIRAKSRPWIDMVFNSLYAMPALVGYFALGGDNLNGQLVVAAIFWCMAMHAYSAVPDIKADQQAKLTTIATTLGYTKTLLLCAVLYSLSAILAFSTLSLLAPILAIIYLIMLFFSARFPDRLFVYYAFFPLINTVIGAILFWSTVLYFAV